MQNTKNSKKDFSNSLRITEIFYSLQGETRTVGLPTVFIRLTGCPLRCSYCDSAYAFHGGTNMSIESILSKVKSFNPRYITVTGGEPLAQKGVFSLLRELCNLNYIVSIETSGAIDISDVDSRVVKILDLKTPSSKMEHKNLYTNLSYLSSFDQIKFVIGDYNDYLWSKELIAKFNLGMRNEAEVLFSPVYGVLELKDLAEWILQDNLNVRMQIQLHKYIWGDIPGK